ncbi:hypothetical protein AV641_12480 [Pseudomonas fragi]|nr:hypothetical protein AV641_12480 [Pseudomonas fragi]
MKPEFRIREVSRYVITRFDDRGTHPIAQVDNRDIAEQLVAALESKAVVDSVELNTPIDDLNFSTRTRNNLIATCGLSTLGDLTKITQVQMLTQRRVGVSTLKEVIQALNQRGLKHQLGVI